MNGWVAGAIVIALFATPASAQTVRTDRPRLLLSNGTGRGTRVATFRERCTSDAAYMGRCQSGITNADGGLWPAVGHAAGYVVNGDASACELAYDAAMRAADDEPGSPDGHTFISNHGRTMPELAVTLDWCFDALDATSRDALIARIVAYADWYLASGAPDVFHDDMNNVWSAVALAGLALAGTSADDDATRYLTAARAQWNDVIFPALEYAGDWWHEGMTYVQPTLGSLAWYASAWSSATDEDVFAAHPALFEGYLRFHAYALRPDATYAYFGDTSDNKQSVELFSRWLIDMMTAGTGSPLGQALSMYIREHSRPGYDYAGANGWMPALFYDASRDAEATPLDSLDTARWLSPGVEDIAILRSGWGDDAMHVYIACGDYMSSHQHDEAGSFQVFRYAPLTGSTGYYDAYNSRHWQDYYSQHSVHANTLAIVQPGEIFPTLAWLSDPSANVNEGGQRVLGLDRSGSTHQVPDLAAYMERRDSGPRYETGTLTSFVHDDCHSYVACDVTAAYTSPGFETNGNTAKVTEVSRQFVLLPPDTLVVFDRVESTDAGYEKRFLLHAMGELAIDGQRYTITNGGGRLIAETQDLGAVDVARVDGFEVDGMPRPPSTTGVQSGGSRVEVSPSAESERDYFLHVLRATDSADTSFPTTSVTQDGTSVTLEADDGARTYTITFDKTGELGGHITVAGDMSCDRDLGAGAVTPDGGTIDVDGGSARGDGGAAQGDGGSAGRDGGPSAMGSDDGCGCSVPGAGRSAPLALLVAVALGLAWRRR